VVGLIQGDRVVTDRDVDLTSLRQPLSPVEIARLAAVGRATSHALTDIAGELRPDDSERDVAAKLRGALALAGVGLRVVLVAGEDRFGHVRHPVPTDRPFGRVGLLVVCASRFGLVASLSRAIAFGGVPDHVAAALERVLRVEAAMLDATQPGVASREVFAAAQAAYGAEGEPEAWQHHHQGGPAGYLPRDWLATPDEGRAIDEGFAVAWNPSLPWAKSEDTFVLLDGKLDALTWDDRWPHALVGGRARALVRNL
jgi:Xaa-Pro dipeptidase